MQKERSISRVGLHPDYDVYVFVQCSMKPRYQGDADEWGTLTVDKVCARSTDVRPDGEKRAYEGVADSPSSFWDWLAAIAPVEGRVAIFSVGARDHAAAMGLWDMVASGDAVLAGTDRRDASSDRGGIVILEDCPTIICFRLANGGSVFTWLDPGNYGARFARPGGKPAVIDDHAYETLLECRKLVMDYRNECRLLRLNTLQHTAASQAAAGYRLTYMHDRIYSHKNAVVTDMERQALFGGRCEARFIGELLSQAGPERPHEEAELPRPVREFLGNLYHLDVNSLYPSVAKNAVLPTRLLAFARDPELSTLHAAIDKKPCVATVSLETPVPVLPYRHNGEVFYPTGGWTGTYAGPELALLLRVGSIVACHALAVYDGSTIYYDYVTRLYAARTAAYNRGDMALAKCLKHTLNASFAKWAQRKRRWVDVTDRVPPAPYLQWWQDGGKTQYRSIGWVMQREEHFEGMDAELPDNVPAITAYVNSLARVRLWELMVTAGRNHVYYYDTDSLICDQYGFDRLRLCHEVHAQELGKLSVRGRHDVVRIIGRQAYECDGELTLSGTSAPHVREGESFARVLKTPPIQHWLLKGQPPGIDRMVCRVRKDRGYRHGHVMHDGAVLAPTVTDLLSQHN